MRSLPHLIAAIVVAVMLYALVMLLGIHADLAHAHDGMRCILAAMKNL